jgi:pimeloyl-ACP methyl ester carboxylesterase
MVRRSLIAIAVLAAPVLAQGAQGERTPKPQEPVGPVAYRSEPVSVPVGAGEPTHTLAGTITLPDAARWGDGPYPGVVLVSGSGPQNRDSELMGHRPFLVLADRLTRAGIAVLRYDDRGVGESTGNFAEGTIPGSAVDAAAAADVLRAHPLVDDARVGLMGHSEGGAVAPIVAAEHPETAFVVILAGMGQSGREILLYQSAFMFGKGGQTEEWIAESTRIRAAIFDAVGGGAADEEVLPLVRALVDYEMPHLMEEERRALAAVQLLPQFTGEWFRHFLTVDPAEALRLVSVPVLALNGTLDMQVPAAENLGAIEAALAEGPCPSATIVRLAGLNHLFQPATTGMLGEYGAIETTFDEGAMGLIAGWIRATVGGGDE